MMQQIANTPFYEITYLPRKNRIYFKVRGLWPSKRSIPNYIMDWRKALTVTQKRFSVLSDLSDMEAHPNDIKEFHEKVEELLNRAGVLKTAEVLADNKLHPFETPMKETTKFETLQAADRWLDYSTATA
ncbi:hypothetical protein FUAX_14740 [Fulvitalea axinellae]|uniref:Integrase n=1 Tax=Fulvitalea axinellae TaxID=1182444 RepID=A0AAU9CMB3_9BACT|nr:hypothetical protein FUAX_14740 [Fulvitalea axinellae]